MAKELFVGVVIGGTLSGAFTAATAGAKTTLKQLGTVADGLKNKHSRMGDVMARAFAHPSRNVSTLRREYDRLGQTLDQVRIKQERLAARLAAGNALKDARAETWGKMKETGAAALAFGAPIGQSVRLAAGFQDQMRDIAITGEFSAAEEAKLGATVRESAQRWNQAQDEIGRGMSILVAGGIQEAKELERYAPVMSKAATATRASMDDLGSVMIALKDNLKIGANESEQAINMLAYAGKRGQFEIRDMAKWLPSLSPSFQALGVTGKEAVAEIGAALQIARKGAGSNDEAANNFRNFLNKITSPDTLKDFEKAGIDLKGSMMNLRAKGFTPVQAMLEVITQYMSTKGPAASAELQKTLAIKDDAEREQALQRLSEAYKLGELFQDMQAMNFIRPAIANMGEMKDIKQGSMGAADKDLLGADFKKRTETANEQFKAFKIGLMEIGLTIGDALLPPLNELLQTIMPVVRSFGTWAKEHPGLVRGIVGLVGGVLALKMGVLGLSWGFNFLVASPLNSVKTAFALISGKWTLPQAAWQAGRFASIVSAFSRVGSIAMMLGRVLAGGLATGVRIAGQAVLWLGRALLMNPIGLAITGIALAAYLIYRYWEPIKAFFRGLWSEVRAAFAGGIGGVARLILNWSPLGLFYRAFAGVMRYFGVSLPKNFSDFGSMLIDGLVGGIKAKLTAARDSIVSFGNSIKGWFTSTLGIKSPSRVFMGFGDNIAEGAAIGIQRTGPLASRAAAAMANATATAAQGGGGRGGRAAGGLAAAGGGMVIHFSPSITVQGGGDVKGAVMEAAQLSMAELERLFRRLMDQQQRRSN
jgi:TP901 family phage tail tape measure protein